MPKKSTEQYDEETIILRDKIYVPASTVDVDAALNRYTHFVYDEKACRVCPNRPERHNFECDQCPAFKGAVATGKTVYKNGIEYVGMPFGDKHNIEKHFGIDFSEFDVIDKRIKNKFEYDIGIKKSFKLRDYQVKAEKDWMRHRHGLIVAPPRSGKTPLMLHIAIRLGLRTILLANQHEFLQQFLDHVVSLTNLPLLEKQTGKKLYGFPKKLEDFETLQIAVCTYQQFLDTDKGRERYKVATKNFGTVLVDEVHRANSNSFARVVSNWPCKYRLGVTGTDKRKDLRHVIMRDVIGNTASRVNIAQMVPKVTVHVCDYVKTRSKFSGPAGFVYACKFLANHEDRTEDILSKVKKDLDNGHSIVIPVHFVDHVWYLVKRINDMMGHEIAQGFTGGGSKKNKEHRELVIENARNGKTRVVVGIRSILQLGLNVPPWSALYYIMPMSNEPNWKQESSRILTPMENKKQPLIRMFVDPNVGLSLGCFVNTYRFSMKFRHAPTEAARERAQQMFELQGVSRRESEYDLEQTKETEVFREKTSKHIQKAKPTATSGLFNRGSKK